MKRKEAISPSYFDLLPDEIIVNIGFLCGMKGAYRLKNSSKDMNRILRPEMNRIILHKVQQEVEQIQKTMDQIQNTIETTRTMLQ